MENEVAHAQWLLPTWLVWTQYKDTTKIHYQETTSCESQQDRMPNWLRSMWKKTKLSPDDVRQGAESAIEGRGSVKVNFKLSKIANV